MKKYVFKQVRNGDILAVHRTENWACCDCGLVHTFRFFNAGRGLKVKVMRNETRTKISRRRKRFAVKIGVRK